MGFIGRVIAGILGNAIALALADYFIPGFILVNDVKKNLLVAVIFTVLHFIVKPIVKLILSPLIILTLGLGLIVINAFLLKLLDFYSGDLTIQTTPALLYATLLISGVNFIVHFVTKPKA